MIPLLFLAHRIPFPPNKGDKLRSFHLLKYLSNYFDIYLGAFVDDTQDWQYQEELNKYAKQVMLRPLKPTIAKIRSLNGFFTGEALSLPYYRDTTMQRWVDKTVKEKTIEHSLIFSSPMAQYVGNVKDKLKKCIADFVDIDSDKWQQYSEEHSFPMKWVYRREANKLLAFERRIAKTFNATLFVSESEKLDFDECAPESISRHGYYNNGVDYMYFDPGLEFTNPFEKEVNAITFTGAMDYWANIDAVKWFVKRVLPLIRKECPQSRFYIVGTNPSDEVIRLQKHEGIVVTGRVDDIRPYMKHSSLIVAPMRIARGIQNKVLEAMAMAKPLVATSLALEGITPCKHYFPLQADTPEMFAKRCIAILQSKDSRTEPQARQCIKENYDWDKNLAAVANLFYGVEQC